MQSSAIYNLYIDWNIYIIIDIPIYIYITCITYRLIELSLISLAVPKAVLGQSGGLLRRNMENNRTCEISVRYSSFCKASGRGIHNVYFIFSRPWNGGHFPGSIESTPGRLFFVSICYELLPQCRNVDREIFPPTRSH